MSKATQAFLGLGLGIVMANSIAGLIDNFGSLVERRACMEAHDTYTCHQQWVPGPEKDTDR